MPLFSLSLVDWHSEFGNVTMEKRPSPEDDIMKCKHVRLKSFKVRLKKVNKWRARQMDMFLQSALFYRFLD